MVINCEVLGEFECDEVDLEIGGYDKVVLVIMYVIVNDVFVEFIFNVVNYGVFFDLFDEVVVEVLCWVDGVGIYWLFIFVLFDYV